MLAFTKEQKSSSLGRRRVGDASNGNSKTASPWNVILLCGSFILFGFVYGVVVLGGKRFDVETGRGGKLRNRIARGKHIVDSLSHLKLKLPKAKEAVAGAAFSAAQSEFDRMLIIEEEASRRALAPSKPRAGFVVLGMHRSGTSMLSGLLVTGMGYHVGDANDLIAPHFDNEKGFFERIDVVLQNDEFMAKQKIGWDRNVINYDYNLALKQLAENKVGFQHGTKGLAFFNANTDDTIPWLHKDPRMCITLRTWLQLINTEPAVVFTYRHPLEVANSLHKRASDMSISQGLRLWIVYNMRAIQNSSDLCRVYSSNEAVLENTLFEIQRISYELTTKCAVPEPPRQITQSNVDMFVDTTLQHNKKAANTNDERRKTTAEKADCVIPEYQSKLDPDDQFARDLEKTLYLKAMKIYCDMKHGFAYDDTYEWPNLD
eukprot:CAMPEP_0195536352 /NCGR_PEP_ID=MMETSP0794_2-20130614/45916_1 /TAXON_ID=515487 /ORGANISM="Stephanopyxis turris, Strain CCMP 815" /LENGTH=430 /DNA_ID=CAMNT_0040669735 /DNA_START=154 /DNA_END=1446 /DNA_ORIENTATION=-